MAPQAVESVSISYPSLRIPSINGIAGSLNGALSDPVRSSWQKAPSLSLDKSMT